jgi:hypothetical protein
MLGNDVLCQAKWPDTLVGEMIAAVIDTTLSRP